MGCFPGLKREHKPRIAYNQDHPMSHCGRYIPPPLTRRDMLNRCAVGFGATALAGLLADKSYGIELTTDRTLERPHPLQPLAPHFVPKARSVIFLYMDGGVSHVDSFDRKIRLEKENGNPVPFTVQPTQFNNNGNLLASPWKFRRYGRSGLEISDLFPAIGHHADELCVIRSMVADFPEHTNANYFLHTGVGIQGRPSVGAWMGYGLGSENQNLPGFVVLNGGLIPPGGLDCFGSGFLPASYQGSVFKPTEQPVANILPREKDPRMQRNKLALMKRLDQRAMQSLGRVDAIESAIANYELAFRMQSAVPELMDIAGETEATKKMYGMDHPWAPTQVYARQCLVARRLVERGVRFIEITCPPTHGNDRWDQHAGLKKGHEENARSVDQPIAALIADLKQRGLLDSTLLVFTGEFGRTPFAQGNNGRDHHPFAFSLWMAGGGVRGGTVYGQSDEFGYYVAENKFTMHDLHATMLHLLGIDHTKLTYRFAGRDIRLTDVHGELHPDILA